MLAWVCSEHILKVFANLSLIMIFFNKKDSYGKEAYVHASITKPWQISLALYYIDKIRNLPRGMDFQFWVQIASNVLKT